MELYEVEVFNISIEVVVLKEEIGVQFSVYVVEVVNVLYSVEENLFYGINLDGLRWWKEIGIEIRFDGVVCRWILNRGVIVDGVVEWEEKYWEVVDGFDYKEFGSEKSGRDVIGNVWYEYWKEVMWQVFGVVYLND